MCAAAPLRWVACCLITWALVGCSSAPDPEEDWFRGGELKPTSVRTLQMTVRVLASKGDTAGAVQVARKMLLEHPEAVESYAETAELLVAGGRYREAVDLLSAGLEVLPENALLCNNRGLCHLLLGDLQGATSDFERAYQADRYDADYVGNLALVRALAGGAEAEREARALWARVLSEEAVEANLRQARKARARFER